MKTIITTIALSLTLILNAQWETKNYVDEFGDDTDIEYKQMVSEGTFSNSATINSKLLAKFEWSESDKSLIIHLFEYGSNKATQADSKTIEIKIKDDKGNVYSMSAFYSGKYGAILLSKKNYEKILPILTTSGKYKMVFTYETRYSIGSTYNITFEI